MAIARNVNDFRNLINLIAEKYRAIHEGLSEDHEAKNSDDIVPDYNLKIPPWLCQPYYRKSPEERAREKAMEAEMKEDEIKVEEETTPTTKKKAYYDREGNIITKNHLKKLKRLERTARIKDERKGLVCEEPQCGNNKGKKCVYKLCGNCCKVLCHREKFACAGHNIKITTENDVENNNTGQEVIMIVEAEGLR